MTLRAATTLDLVTIADEVKLQVSGNVTVKGITHDSREVRAGDLYVAIPGLQQHGINFLSEAIQKGAVAVATDEQGTLECEKLGVPFIVLENPRKDMARLASCAYGHPEQKLRLIGVTGTNGKTTVTQMLRHVLSAQGRRVGVIGTLGAFVGDEQINTLRTTPESTDLYALLAHMHAAGADTVCMEVSSHALVLDRVAGLHFDVSIFTNLTQDHLDFHGDMEAYFAAKALLFEAEMSKSAVINIDDEWGMKLAGQSSCSQVVTVGEKGQRSITAQQTKIDGTTSFTLKNEQGAVAVVVPMFGLFNATNAALCLTTVQLLGGDVDNAVGALASLPQVPGRMEIVWSDNQRLAIVDYAHTPDALEKALQQIRSIQPKRILTVFGCGGDRDSSKRTIMGSLAAQNSDIVIVTDDNPRSENPALIREAIINGTHGCTAVIENIGDRRMAIKRVIDMCEPGDVIAVLGKGHESGQEVAGVVTPFDDRDVVRQEAQNA